MGAWRISRAQVLTRRVSAIEALGAATVLCTDKTGTLTQNRMTVVALRAAAQSFRPESGPNFSPDAAALIRYAILASAREPFDPMEKAFYALGNKALSPNDEPHRGLVLKWEYGLR